jgi:hypothetical protein
MIQWYSKALMHGMCFCFAAGAESDSGDYVIVDFSKTSAKFPPSVNKIGFNCFWNSASNDHDYDNETIIRSSAFRAPMISGLIEPDTAVNVAGYVDHFEELENMDAGNCIPRQYPKTDSFHF